MKNKTERTCTVCRKKSSKNEFIRIAKNKDGLVLIDYTMKAEGRGAYICRDIECIKNAEKKSALERSFKTKIDRLLYKQLEEFADAERPGK